MGLISGITTNPSLLAKMLKNASQELCISSFQSYVCQICDACPQLPVSVQVTEELSEAMIQQGTWFHTFSPQIVVKVPITPEGLKACKALTEQGISVNVTLCFSMNQAILAAQAGATYISAFWGRFEDHGGDGFTLIQEIRSMLDQSYFDSELLAASIRTPHQTYRAALGGAHISTVPFTVLKAMFIHPLTEQGIHTFRKDSTVLSHYLPQQNVGNKE